MSFLKYFAGFFALGMAKDVIDEYTNKQNAGYKGDNNTNNYSNSNDYSDSSSGSNELESWMDSKGLLNIDGSINHAAAAEFLKKP